MTTQATRLLLIRSHVASGQVPTIRAMRDLLAVDGISACLKTIGSDYERLGIQSPSGCGRKRTGRTSTKIELRIPNSIYDHCSRIALQRGVSLASVLRAYVDVGIRRSSAA